MTCLQLAKPQNTEVNSVTLNLKDVKLEIGGVEWEQAIKKHLKQNGYDNVGFEYRAGNWVTVYKK